MRESVKRGFVGAVTWVVVRALLGVLVSGESVPEAVLAGVPGALAFGVVYAFVDARRN